MGALLGNVVFKRAVGKVGRGRVVEAVLVGVTVLTLAVIPVITMWEVKSNPSTMYFDKFC